MSEPGSMVANAGWRELVGLASAESDERAFLRGLLGLLGTSHGLSGSALYVAAERGLERELTHGSGSFPRWLSDEQLADPRCVRLPGSALLIESERAAPESLEASITVALISAVRAYSLRRSLEKQKFEVNYRGVGLEALYDVGLAIASTLDLEKLTEEILLRAVSLLDARRGALYLVEGGLYRRDRTLGGDAKPELALDDPLVETALGSRERPDQDLLPGARYLMAVKIESDRQLRGLLVVGDKESRRGIGPFQGADRRTLSLFANQAAIALENAHLHRQALEKERLERDMELAADIQRRLLPASFPTVEGFEIVGWSRPARHVGGDYYDLLDLPGGKLAGVVADVSGKGMPAALMVSTVHSALRLLLDRNEVGPAMLDRLNRHVLDSSAPNRFITLLVFELDPASGGLRYVNAGHNPALVLGAGGDIGTLEPCGLPLGLFAESPYRVESRELAPGDLLCLFSDGITECESPAGEEFGVGRLTQVLRAQRERPLPELVTAVDRAVADFACGTPQADDQTLLFLRRRPKPV